MKMQLKQSFARSQPKSVKDFLVVPEKPQNKLKPNDDANFFTRLAQRTQTA
ncbi:hypothetical protein [Atlantibacter hermannii]|uniref:hypothetical protein n=1 Tax=Atlantibacter hermannii TaxID=565 RepID=UPI0028B14681|nr:hypothetical protein [Atlantibacter hermannii]